MHKPIVIVTGATGTLGTAVYKQLLDEHYHPVLLARNAEALAKIKQTHGNKLDIFPCDTADDTAIKQLFNQPFMEGQLAGVIACAGVLQMKPSVDMPPEAWNDILRTNLTGTFTLFQNAIPHMPGGGSLVAIGSRWANGAKTAAAYAASKAGLRGMITSLQKEYAGTAIRPVLISPGSIASPMSGAVNTGTQQLDILRAEDVSETIIHVLKSPQRVIFQEITMLAYNYDLTDEYHS